MSDQLYFRALSTGWTAGVHHRDADKPVLAGRRPHSAGFAHQWVSR
ncbi:hypothetical protein [Kutzneria buriramensis]|nr:hypothetical protein [Kutzneria buriramensis]